MAASTGLLAALEADLRGICAEARRSDGFAGLFTSTDHPEIKEAAERAMLKLRMLADSAGPTAQIKATRVRAGPLARGGWAGVCVARSRPIGVPRNGCLRLPRRAVLVVQPERRGAAAEETRGSERAWRGRKVTGARSGVGGTGPRSSRRALGRETRGRERQDELYGVLFGACPAVEEVSQFGGAEVGGKKDYEVEGRAECRVEGRRGGMRGDPARRT